MALAVVVAHGFFVHLLLFPSALDADHYVRAGMDIAANGPFARFHGADVRTYGYPLFLAGVMRLAGATGLPVRAVLFETQLFLFLVAAWRVRRAVAEHNPLVARIVFCGLVANYYSLLHSADSLTESLSLTLLLVVTGSWLRLWRRPSALGPLVAGSLAAGFAPMVRPGSLFILAPWVVGCVLVWFEQRPRFRFQAWRWLIVAATVALLFVPQVLNNGRFFGRWTPLVVVDLAHAQQSWGVRYLKYATGLPPAPTPSIFYDNPLVAGTTVSAPAPWRWYVEYPGRGLLTLALHLFNLTDQDLLFTYSRDLWPWYRIPLGVVNHGVVALGWMGLGLVGVAGYGARDVGARTAFRFLAVLLAAYATVYAQTAVEMRFGSVLLQVLFPLAGHAVLRVRGWSRGARGMVAMVVALYVIGSLLLSGWVRSQSAQIRESAGKAGRSTMSASATSAR